MKATELLNLIEQTSQLYITAVRELRKNDDAKEIFVPAEIYGMNGMLDHIIETLKIFFEVTDEGDVE